MSGEGINAADISSIRLEEQSATPATPAAGYASLFADNGKPSLWMLDDAGVKRGGAGLFTHVRRTIAQSIPDNTWTSISWNNETVDDEGLFDIGSPTVLTAAAPGIFIPVVRVYWAAGATSTRAARFVYSVAGTVTYLNETTAVTNALVRMAVGMPVAMAAAETLKIDVFQTTGGALNLTDAELALIRLR